MPKLKTRKALAKRFRFTGTGKIKRSKAFRRHMLTKKSRSKKRALRKASFVSKSQAKMVRRLMPYG